jgi:hypothetical protein
MVLVQVVVVVAAAVVAAVVVEVRAYQCPLERYRDFVNLVRGRFRGRPIIPPSLNPVFRSTAPETPEMQREVLTVSLDRLGLIPDVGFFVWGLGSRRIG